MAAPTNVKTSTFDVAHTENFGYVFSKQTAEALKEHHELNKTLRFVSLKTSSQFGSTPIDRCKHRILWEEAQPSHGGKIQYDGIPFIHLNKNIYECEYAKDHKVKCKVKAKEARAEKRMREPTIGNAHKPRNLIQDTKKKGCQAKLVMKEIMKFPEFKITKNSNSERRKGAKRTYDAIKAGHAEGERRIYIYLPEDSQHDGHPVGKICGARQRVDHRIIGYIQRMVAAGVTSLAEMKIHVERFVAGALFNGKQIPDLSNRRYFPEDSDIRYHMYTAEGKKRINQTDIEMDISQWMKEDPHQRFLYRSGTKKPHRSESCTATSKQFKHQQQLLPHHQASSLSSDCSLVQHQSAYEPHVQLAPSQQGLVLPQANRLAVEQQQKRHQQDLDQEYPNAKQSHQGLPVPSPQEQSQFHNMQQMQQVYHNNHVIDAATSLPVTTQPYDSTSLPVTTPPADSLQHQELQLLHPQQPQCFPPALPSGTSPHIHVPHHKLTTPILQTPTSVSSMSLQDAPQDGPEVHQTIQSRTLQQNLSQLQHPTHSMQQQPVSDSLQHQVQHIQRVQYLQQMQHPQEGQYVQPVKPTMPPGDTLLLVHQTLWQQYLLARYGNELCILDPVFRTTGCTLPLFFILVKTNCDYQVVATFIVEEARQVLINEALTVLKEWNPSWLPANFLTDIAQDDVNAVQQAFPGYSIYFCDYHRQYAWDQWLNLESIELGTVRHNVLNMFNRLANASTESEYMASIVHLQGSQAWSKHSSLRDWLGKFWLPMHSRWVRAFRRQSFIKAVNTAFGIGLQNKIFKECCLQDEKQPKLSQLMNDILYRFLPKNKSWYFQCNSKADDGCRKYSTSIPSFLQKRPRSFLKTCLQQWKTAATIPPDRIKLLDKTCGIFHIQAPSATDCITVNMMRPDCSCKTWERSALPCKHILAVIIHDKAWSWEKLPSSYTESPYFNIDYDFVSKIVGNESPTIITSPSALETDRHIHDSDQCILDTLPRGDPLEHNDIGSPNKTNGPSPCGILDQGHNQEQDQVSYLVLGKCQAVLERLQSKILFVKEESNLESVLSILDKTEIAIDRSIIGNTTLESVSPTLKRRKTTWKDASR